jgi:hypothetical protein
MSSKHADREAGFTIAELAFGLLVMVIAAVVMVDHLSITYQTTLAERDRVFAFSKAETILSEIQVFVDRGQVNAAVDLDALDDGLVNKPTLTIATDSAGALLPPDHVVSGNYLSQLIGQWKWSRRITVQPFTGLNNRNVRYVTVRVYKKDSSGNDQPVADLSAVINSSSSGFPATQVFDVYLLALENIPGWWVFMDSIRPFVESTITDLETRNPGLEVRTHWITKASFGRNPVYRPHMNDAVDSWQPISQVYCYPGRMPSGSASTYYYVPGNIKGHIELDGADKNGFDATLNPHPYALADWFNHGMRLPDELALWQQRVADVTACEQAIAAANAAGTTPPPALDDMSKEPTMRLLLEDLYSSPLKYQNAMVINLHGELLPMPALRNYSDAARDPVNMPEVRVVTHPEELRTRRDAVTPASSDPVRLRVYAYNTNNATYAGPELMPLPMVVEVMGVDLTVAGGPTLKPAHTLQSLRGGAMVGGTRAYSALATAKVQGDPSLIAGEMYYRAVFVDPAVAGQDRFTRIFLYNTPVVCTQDLVGKGLQTGTAAIAKRALLYGMPYVPCPTEAARDFSRNLFTDGVGPKNTARWVLSIAPSCLTDNSLVDNNGVQYAAAGDLVVKVRTRIWSGPDPATTGTMWPPANRNMPENLSVTYTWWGDSKEDVPITERSQFIGDPRHCPYKDVGSGDPDFADGYNWFFDALNNGGENSRADYPGLTAANLCNRWRGVIGYDVPRYFELIRKGLVKSRCVYTSLTGWSYYYMGIGNDIGSDANNGYPNSIPVCGTPFGSAAASFYLDTITGSRRFVRGTGAGYWWGMPWLGQLSPDSAYVSQWFALDANGNLRGNMDAGSGANQYYQAAANSVYAGSNRLAFGTSLLDSVQRTNREGCTSFFNVGTSASTFHHRSSSGNGNLTATGNEIATTYNLRMPAAVPISRPFSVAANTDGTIGTEYTFTPYSTERFAATLLKTYYDHPLTGATGSGLVKLTDNTGANSAYIVVNGIDSTVESGSSFIAKYAVLSLVHSLFEVGDTANTNRIKMPPRVEITSPTDITELTNPASISVQFNVTWKRWDGLPYTPTGTFGEAESELQYALMYSNDGGANWYYIDDNSPATPGQLPASTHLVADAVTGPETVNWPTPPTLFPNGSYLLRIDCFRVGSSIHYSYHKSKFFIAR